MHSCSLGYGTLTTTTECHTLYLSVTNKVLGNNVIDFVKHISQWQRFVCNFGLFYLGYYKLKCN